MVLLVLAFPAPPLAQPGPTNKAANEDPVVLLADRIAVFFTGHYKFYPKTDNGLGSLMILIDKNNRYPDMFGLLRNATYKTVQEGKVSDKARACSSKDIAKAGVCCTENPSLDCLEHLASLKAESLGDKALKGMGTFGGSVFLIGREVARNSHIHDLRKNQVPGGNFLYWWRPPGNSPLAALGFYPGQTQLLTRIDSSLVARLAATLGYMAPVLRSSTDIAIDEAGVIQCSADGFRLVTTKWEGIQAALPSMSLSPDGPVNVITSEGSTRKRYVALDVIADTETSWFRIRVGGAEVAGKDSDATEFLTKLRERNSSPFRCLGGQEGSDQILSLRPQLSQRDRAIVMFYSLYLLGYWNTQKALTDLQLPEQLKPN